MGECLRVSDEEPSLARARYQQPSVRGSLRGERRGAGASPAAYSRATGLELTRSEFLRAVLSALEPTIALHEREATGIGPLRRAKNEAWLLHKRDELERAIARAFTAAMRAAPNFG